MKKYIFLIFLIVIHPPNVLPGSLTSYPSPSSSLPSTAPDNCRNGWNILTVVGNGKAISSGDGNKAKLASGIIRTVSIIYYVNMLHCIATS